MGTKQAHQWKEAMKRAKADGKAPTNFNTTATFGGTNGKIPINDSSELVKEINRLKAALASRKENEGRIAELLSQNSQLKMELHATKTNLEAAKAAVSAPSKSEEFIFRARRAAIRPILKKWRAAKISVGFAAFESNFNEQANKEGKEAFVKKRRARGAQLMYKTLQRALHARILRSWNTWEQKCQKIRHEIDKETAIKEALAVSSDKAKARGLENYCRAAIAARGGNRCK